MSLAQVITLLLAVSCVASACGAESGPGTVRKATDGITAQGGKLSNPSNKLMSQRDGEMITKRIVISSDRGEVTAELVENDATKTLLSMLPLTIAMRDHLRQEKTGSLPAPLPEQPRQIDFSAGTIGLWDTHDFVIYYREGRVPSPGIVVLGRVKGNVAIFDVPGSVTVRIREDT